MKILIIDNFDSFTYNLFQYIAEYTRDIPEVVLNTHNIQDIDFDYYDGIVISPGPGNPTTHSDIGISSKVIEISTVPVLGICLGHQILGCTHGMKVAHAPEPMHGRLSNITHNKSGLFEGIEQQTQVVRYHSLIVTDLTDDLFITAWDDEGLIQGLQHKTRPLYGVQFHPESIMTRRGSDMIKNFVTICANFAPAITTVQDKKRIIT